MQGVSDFRKVLKPYVGKDSSIIASDYQGKVDDARREEAANQKMGMGGWMRSSAARQEVPASQARGGVTSKDIVGDAPTGPLPGPPGGVGKDEVPTTRTAPLPEEEQGGLWKSLRKMSKEREAELRKKNEAFQKVMEQKAAQAKEEADAQSARA